MVTTQEQSFNKHSIKEYPVLRLGYADVFLLGKWDDLSNALYSLHKDKTLWVQYIADTAKNIVETYTLLNGIVEIEYERTVRVFEIGETIDASKYKKIIAFHSKSEADILIKMSAESFEPRFFETQLLQEESDAIEAIDGYTYMHCNRIKDYSIEVWKYLQLPVNRLGILRWGAYFHDIGKCIVPSEILQKPGNLTADEWNIMKSHTTEGAKIMRNHSVEWLKEAAFIVEQHHERYDGMGYPKGLKGDEIALEAAIVSVVDAFDAMTTDRVYKKSLPVLEAVQEIRDGKGTQFNPIIVDAFIEVLKHKQFKWK
jgi:putative nucleotidyltransferase with HDIG domain